jgi:DedD protein
MDQQLKERLVGAVVLMVAAVVFIPMILSGPPEPAPAPPRQAAAPARTPADFSSRIVPLTASETQPPRAAAAPSPAAEPAREPAARPAPAPEPAPPPQAAVPSPAPERVPPPQAAAPSPAPPRTSASDTPAAASREARAGWVVQLGSFSNARNAYALRDRLKDNGFAAFAESAGAGADAVTRVYVGPEPDRERAEKHVARLLEQTRLKGIVVRYPGE